MKAFFMSIKRKLRKKSGFSLVDAIAGVALMVTISAVVIPILGRGMDFIYDSANMRKSSYNAVSAVSKNSDYENAEINTANNTDYKVTYTIDFEGSTPTMTKYNSYYGDDQVISGQKQIKIVDTEDGLVTYYATNE